MARARGPNVTPEVEALITKLYEDHHPKWKAPKVRYEAECILRKDNPKLPVGWPSLSKVQKILAEVRRNQAQPDPQSQPWAIGTLEEYPISPEALPVVLGVCSYARQADNVFSIRQAKWAARLSGMLKGEPPWYLWYWTDRYAGADAISRLINRPLDTATLDAQLTRPDAKQLAEDQLKHQAKASESSGPPPGVICEWDTEGIEKQA